MNVRRHRCDIRQVTGIATLEAAFIPAVLVPVEKDLPFIASGATAYF
jgi:hypothetical protein